MATVTKVRLSGSTDNRPIVVSATALAGAVTIHNVNSSTSVLDQVYLWAVNNNTQSRDIFIYFGTTATTTIIQTRVEHQVGPQLIVGGISLVGAASATITAHASGSDSILIMGEINRIDQT